MKVILALFYLAACLSMFAVLSGCGDTRSNTQWLDKNYPVVEPSLSNKTNGLYTGEFSIYPPFGTIVFLPHCSVSVMVSNQRYSYVAINDPSTNTHPRKDALVRYTKEIVEKQSIMVDAVSGATFATRTLQMAVMQALK